jgi:cytochrome b
MSVNNQVRICDPLIRIFHWTLVTAFFIAYFTDDDDFLLPHVWAGYAVIGLLVFRLLWGFIGTAHARFSDFICAPSTAVTFVRDTVKGKAKRYLGHNPAGGWMIIIMLTVLTLLSVTGLLLYGADEHAGPAAGIVAGIGKDFTKSLEHLHEFFANFMVLLVMTHVAGVVAESVLHRENPARAMVTGLKRAADNEQAASKRGRGGAIILNGLFAITFALFTVGVMIGSGRAEGDTKNIEDLRGAVNLVPLEEIIAKAKEQHAGQLIEAQLKMHDGRAIYEIEILDDHGKVWETYFDANSGKPIIEDE